MPLHDFLEDLLETGQVRVSAEGEPLAEELERVEELLRTHDERARLELPPGVPPLAMAAAAWAASTLYWGCRLLTFRDLPAAEVGRVLARPCPGPHDASAAYSVDLSLRSLPDLLRLARGIAAEDPLVVGLTGLAADWPLSAVGAPGVAIGDLSVVVGDPCLLALYADRILETGDVGRLGHPAVDRAVAARLGAHPELAPTVASALETVP